MSKSYLKLRTMLAVGAVLALAACGGNTTTTSTQTGATTQATSVAESGAAETGTPASGEAASTDAATVEPTGAATEEATTEAKTDATAGTATPDATTSTDAGTATPEAGATTEAGTDSTGVSASTPLTGPNISFGGVTFDVDDSVIPSVSVQSGAVNMMGMAGTTGSSTSSASSGVLSGTIFTFEGINAGSADTPSGVFQPRILVIPVSQLVSYESAMMAGGMSTAAGATDAMTATAEATTASNSSMTDTMTSTMESTSAMTGTMGSMSEDSFISELSRTISSQSSFASTAMSSSMVLTRALSLLGFEGYSLAFQSNGEAIEFQNGRGVRFVTAFQQDGSSPASINQLYYLFHGLTNDNRTYVMAIMPLQSNLLGMGSTSTSSTGTSSSTSTTDTMTSTAEMTGTGTMTSTDMMTGTGMIEFPVGGDAAAYQDYLDQWVQGLDEAGAGTSDALFTQALQQYDSVIESLNISESAQ